MGILRETFINLFGKNRNYFDDKGKYIFYKIIDSQAQETGERYKIQCSNKKNIFYATLDDIVFDTTILHGFHPAQACYIGMEYAKKSKERKSHLPENKMGSVGNGVTSRYGKYTILSQDRKGNVCFLCKETSENFLMDPRDIALSKELIEEFDSSESFHIGFLAGLKLNNLIKNTSVSTITSKNAHLRVVK